MENLGQKITELRKKNNLTQSELGEKLNVTSQAVSKWENNLSEPDLDTTKKLCEIFGISMNELMGLESPTLAQHEPAPEPAPTSIKEENAQQPQIILGYCKKCNKPVSHGEYQVDEDGIGVICNDCFNERVATRKANIIKDRKSDFKKGLIWGGVVLTLGLLLGLIVGLSGANMGLCDVGTTWLMIGMGALLGYMVSSLVAECIWDGSAFDVLIFFSRSFRMPGIIFEFSWDGFKFLIAMKILFAILSAVLSVACFLVGVVVSSIYASIIFPFSLIATVKGFNGEENTL